MDANNPVIHVTADSATPMEATAFVEIWRTNQCELAEVQVSDVMNEHGKPQSKHAPTILEPDTVLSGQHDRVGWFHHNIKSVGPEMLAQVQGLTGFKQADPLLHRTFGAVVTADKGERLDDRRLRSPRGNSHRFSVFVLTRHPATPEQWLAGMDDTIRRVEAQEFANRRQAHNDWWSAFWDRSWIRASANAASKPSLVSLVPKNAHPVRIGMDQGGGNKFAGELGRVSIFNEALPESEIQALARSDRHPLAGKPKLLFSSNALGTVSNSAGWDFGPGMTVEAWVKPQKLPGRRRAPGGQDHGGRQRRLPARHPSRQQPSLHLRRDHSSASGRPSCRSLDARGGGRGFRRGRLPPLRERQARGR